MSKKIFVTGAMGFLGGYWCKRLLKEGFIVYGLDIKSNNIKHKNFTYFKKSVFNYKLIERLIKKSDIICHFAGIAEPTKYLTNTKKKINFQKFNKGMFSGIGGVYFFDKKTLLNLFKDFKIIELEEKIIFDRNTNKVKLASWSIVVKKK